MKIICFLLFCPALLFAQPNYKIETADIRHFWQAFDKMPESATLDDSIRIIETEYIGRATPYFKEFVRVRQFTAREYVGIIRAYPKFWQSIRPLTERIESRQDDIQQVFQQLHQKLPGFKQPDVCFAIGCLRTGGTTTRHLILIGSEIAAADSSVDKSELDAWLKSVVGNTGDIVSMIAHESVHTQQHGFPIGDLFRLVKHKKLTLLNAAIMEGSADFITMELLGLNINSSIHQYGKAHRDELWKDFKNAIRQTPFDYSQWLYNGSNAKDRPADLGYFMGYEITKAFYENAHNKRKALKTILKRGKYKKVYRKSGYRNK